MNVLYAYMSQCIWIGRGGGSSAVAIPLGDVSEGNEVSETID